MNTDEIKELEVKVLKEIDGPPPPSDLPADTKWYIPITSIWRFIKLIITGKDW
jgi:hypothetical protein